MAGGDHSGPRNTPFEAVGEVPLDHKGQHHSIVDHMPPDPTAYRECLPANPPTAVRLSALIATQEAIGLVQSTAGRDWSSMTALAAAYSHGEKKERAVQAIDAAIRIAPRHAIKICETWRDQLQDKQPIQPMW